MKILKYFVEFIIISILFLIFKILGYRLSSNLGGFIGQIFGPLLRSKKTIYKNLKKAFPLINDNEIKKISKNMWSNYGRIFSDYMHLKNFRSSKLDKYLIFNGKKILLEVHLFNFYGNLYNKYLTVEFKKFIRKEKKFKNVHQLKKQIKTDLLKAKK